MPDLESRVRHHLIARAELHPAVGPGHARHPPGELRLSPALLEESVVRGHAVELIYQSRPRWSCSGVNLSVMDIANFQEYFKEISTEKLNWLINVVNKPF